MIDIHSHLIPMVDDGSETEEISLNMAKGLYEQGVTDVICTPHFTNGYKAEYEEITKLAEKLKADLKEAGVPLNIYLGREIFVTKLTKQQLKEYDRKFTLNGSEYVLIEFDLVNQSEIAETVYEIANKGYIPIVAHIERYEYCTIDEAIEVKEMGGMIQVNADSIAGTSKKLHHKMVKKLFKNGLVDFVASDLHDGRDIVMQDAYKIVKRKFGEETAEEVFYKNAKKILKG